MTELVQAVNKAKEEKDPRRRLRRLHPDEDEVKVTEEELYNVAAMKVAMETLAAKYGCSAVAIQCWNALQDELGIMPCCANSLLTDEGLPVVCETDIHGAITSILVQAAAMDERPIFFADWTVRHPTNNNAELLQHCGPWPISLGEGKARAHLSAGF